MLNIEGKIKRLQEIQNKELAIYKNKNEKYGDSFSLTVQLYGLTAALTRISDKFRRLEHLILKNELEENMEIEESIIDTLTDMANYCNMTIMEIEVMLRK